MLKFVCTLVIQSWGKISFNRYLSTNWKICMNRAKFVILFLSGAKRVLIAQGILILVPLPTNGAKLLPWTENFQPITVNTTYSNFLIRGVFWHLLLVMGPNLKHLLRLSHLKYILTAKLGAVDKSTKHKFSPS